MGILALPNHRSAGRARSIERNSKKGEAIHGGRPQQSSGSPAAAPTNPPPQELGQAGWHVGEARGCFPVPLNETVTTTSCNGAFYSEALGLPVFSASKIGGIRGSRTLLPGWHPPPTHHSAVQPGSSFIVNKRLTKVKPRSSANLRKREPLAVSAGDRIA